MTSIAILLVISVGIIPAYAQQPAVWPTDAGGTHNTLFWDYDNPPTCDRAANVSAVGQGFTVGTIVTISITHHPENHNIGAQFNNIGIPVLYGPSVERGWDVNVDANGDINPIPIMMASGTPAGHYNMIVDLAGDLSFLPGTDVVDVVDDRGLTVISCTHYGKLLTVKQDSVSSRTIESSKSLDVVGTNLPFGDSSKAYTLSILTHDTLGDGATTITDLRTTSTTFFEDVYINSDGEFTDTITWDDPTAGEYNIILDMNNDGAYTPGIDLVDYIDEIGFTVYSISDPLSVASSCEVVYNEIPDWVDFFGGFVGHNLYNLIFNHENGSACDPDNNFGHNIASGDFNGDGHADLIVSSPKWDVGISSSNTSDDVPVTSIPFAILGSLPVTLIDFIIPGLQPTIEVALAHADEPASVSDAGKISIIYGYNGELSPVAQIWHQDVDDIRGTADTDDHFGDIVAVGDFNNDGYDDLAIGVPDEDVDGDDDAGAVNIIYGSKDGFTGSDDQLWHQGSGTIEGAVETDDHFGYSLAVGDFNNDDYDDLAIGAPEEDVNGENDAGAVNIIYGSKDGLTDIDNQIWHQDIDGIRGVSEYDDHFGYSLAVGDFDNDDYDDLAIGVPKENIGGDDDAGAVNIIYGSDSGLTDRDQLWDRDSDGINGATKYDDHFGHSLAVGDFNNDDYDDLAIGAPKDDIGSDDDAGAVNIIYGSEDGLTKSGDQLWDRDSDGINGATKYDDHFGYSLAVGDFNNDDYDDLAIGAPEDDVNGENDAGAVNIIYGSKDGLTKSGDQLWDQDVLGIIGDGSEEGDRFGHSLTVGDFNNDGIDDLAIGVPEEEYSGSDDDVGAVNIIYGFPDGLTIP